jgi:hypothetical protein
MRFASFLQCLTVFSASNYYSPGSNKGAFVVLEANSSHLRPKFVQYVVLTPLVHGYPAAIPANTESQAENRHQHHDEVNSSRQGHHGQTSGRVVQQQSSGGRSVTSGQQAGKVTTYMKRLLFI